MCINLCIQLCGLSRLTSSSVSEQDREKIFPFFLALSSSVVGGVMGNLASFGMRPNFGTFILPLGFLFAFVRRPGDLIGTRFLGVEGPWIFVICFMRVGRLGDWEGRNFFVSFFSIKRFLVLSSFNIRIGSDCIFK